MSQLPLMNDSNHSTLDCWAPAFGEHETSATIWLYWN